MAYAFARYNTDGLPLRLFVLSSQMLPPVILVLPLFTLFLKASLLNTLPGLIAAHMTISLPFLAWLLIAFFEGDVALLEQAARVDGEFMVLLGPSGCGKSTTLRMIAGLEEVSSGEIRIDGRVVNNVDPAERDLAVVFQNYALYPHMTVAGNLAFGLKLRRVDAAGIERRINGTATMLGIEGLLGRRPRELSGGQQQRVALGPEVVLIAALPGGEEIAARLGRSFSAPVGTGLRLYADLERVHLFDSENGRAVDENCSSKL